MLILSVGIIYIFSFGGTIHCFVVHPQFIEGLHDSKRIHPNDEGCRSSWLGLAIPPNKSSFSGDSKNSL